MDIPPSPIMEQVKLAETTYAGPQGGLVNESRKKKVIQADFGLDFWRRAGC